MRLDRTILTFVLLGAAVAVPAVAQSQGSTLSTYPECKSKPTKEDSEAAHAAFSFGRKKVDEADYSTAINYFKDAYRTDCTKPELLLMIARTYELAGNRAEAINAIEAYLKRVPDAPDAETQRTRIANLRTPSATSSASGSTAPTATQTATAPTTTVTAPPPTATPPPPTLPPPIEPPPPQPTQHGLAPWILVGAGGVVTITGVVLIFVGNGSVSSANDQFVSKGCNVSAHTCPITGSGAVTTADISRLNNNLQTGYSERTFGWVGLGVGVAAVAGGLIWHFLETPGPGGESAASLRPIVAPGYAGAAVGGAF